MNENYPQHRNLVNFFLVTEPEAENVLNALRALITGYKVARVADLYDLVGLKASIEDERWGWTDLGSARVMSVEGGYRIEFPSSELIAINLQQSYSLIQVRITRRN